MSAVLKIVPEERTCKTCCVSKPLDDFRKAKKMQFGVSYKCKACFNANRRKKAEANKMQREKLWARLTHKTCSRCNQEKPIKDFSKTKDRKIGITPDCKTCRNARYKDSRRGRKDRVFSKYGVTYEQVVNVLAQQGGLCANRGCGKEVSLAVPMGPNRAVIDHCHKKDKFRAVLCQRCNLALGQVEDNPNKILGLIDYLNKHR